MGKEKTQEQGNLGTNESEEKSKPKSKSKKKNGFFSRIWNALFGSRNEDLERKLERISKEEKCLIGRISRRSQWWATIKRNIIIIFLFLEVIAVGFAIITARTADNWKNRAFRVLPMFLLPALCSVTYSALSSFIKMCDRKDQKTLEKLRSERKAKIDELKERTNYYLTQQLIQRYDSDPAAKAAATAVLASKFTEGSGLKFSLEEESNVNTGKSHDFEAAQSSGLRNRKQGSQGRPTSPEGTTIQQQHSKTSPHAGLEYGQQNQQLFVNHSQGQGATAYNNGWLSRIAALFVGEDPSQCFALICGNCHMHNGLASKEDFPYMTYICPHCRAVNGPRIKQEQTSMNESQNMGSVVSVDTGKSIGHVISSPREKVVSTDNPDIAAPEPMYAPAESGQKTEVSTEVKS